MSAEPKRDVASDFPATVSELCAVFSHRWCVIGLQNLPIWSWNSDTKAGAVRAATEALGCRWWRLWLRGYRVRRLDIWDLTRKV